MMISFKKGKSCSKSSVSAKVKIAKMDIKVKRVWSSPGERMYILQDDKTDVSNAESSVGKLRRVRIKRQEEVNFVNANADAALGDEGTVELKIQNKIGSEPEGGEVALVGAKERKCGSLKCHHCKRDFGGKDELIRHLGLHNYEVNGKNCGEGRDLNVNINVNCNSKPGNSETFTQTAAKPYVCQVCEMTFSHDDTFKLHMQMHKDEKTYACEECGMQFNRIGHLIRHIRVHSGEKPFACEICGKRFTQKSILIRHGIVHSGEKPFACDVCGKRFIENCLLASHRLAHGRKKPCTCKTCGKSFIRKSDLINHCRIHTGEKPYECEVCSSRFAHKSTLVCHRRVHTGEKPFECDVCGKGFTQSSNLIGHRLVHRGEKP